MPEQLNLFSDAFPISRPISEHPLYRLWDRIIYRCHNPNSKSFASYGGRGISVCDEWRKSSRSFIQWAIKSGYKPGLQIDRINNDGNYCPSNCRFVSRRDNLNNRRNTLRMPDGVPLADAIRQSGLPRRFVENRLRAGWSHADALNIPKGVKRPAKSKGGG